ncbi:type II toxin-antitoxin system PemK/MazF family toxin [Halomicrobium sp. IBSBa]|uniref:type II toxin-antitoxin system PemK/MazF family toxin n=1 Tax=Halomicrobium sp. IBSBa TaxID=2778916 RepID=UPI001ABEEF62|nr:type II toxin-antitoxin system PemK/MazF family toxin [Halomicrobium sp. IBSBa]MBO4249487.1 type II toxin-antitoxin system PemK/MazF family toxin [Halomicrobium sp. IBSBa]
MKYDRGDVVSLDDPYGNDKTRSAVIISDGRRPTHEDGAIRYNVVMLTTQIGEFGGHDWTQILDANGDTKSGDALLKDSVVEPWGTYVIREEKLNGPHAQLTDAGMKKIARSLANLVLR